MSEPRSEHEPPYVCQPCQFGTCHRCKGCTCADDDHGGLSAEDFVPKKAGSDYE